MNGVRSYPGSLAVVLAGGLMVLLLAACGEETETGRIEFLAPPVVATTSPAPAARVPPPKPFDPRTFELPPVEGGSGQFPSLELRVDLDLVAPLGDGAGNLAAWLLPLVEQGGARWDERRAADASRKRVELPWGRRARVLAADHPLLLEAEGWVNQAMCRFFPEGSELEGFYPSLPHSMSFYFTLAESWIARGLERDSRVEAEEDYRRAVRLGRLLLQDDVDSLQHTLGVVIIRFGGEALYEEARQVGDVEGMLLAASVVREGRRHIRLARLRLAYSGSLFRRRGERIEPAGDLHGLILSQVIQVARRDPARRKRIQAIGMLYAFRHAGDASLRERAEETLTELERNEDRLLASHARWARRAPWDPRAGIYFVPSEEAGPWMDELAGGPP